ncbi:PAR14-like protein [Mya arenaria]|uniref:PAR14-like protein n=1 Tax=Mya arenaria TaxID=6604 RepID=A0ABY7FJG7_MYAAR|nr:PAR14-like protein [Mya arenaria]
MSGNLRVYGDVDEEAEETPVVGDGGKAETVKVYEPEKTQVIEKFFTDQLLKINNVGLITRDPEIGKQGKFIIKCVPSKRERLTPLLDKLDREIESFQYEDVSMTENFSLLADYIRKEEQSKSPVLYLPDAANHNVRVYYREDDRHIVIKLRRELGIIPKQGSRRRRTQTQQEEQEMNVYHDNSNVRPQGDPRRNFDDAMKFGSKASGNVDDDDDCQYEEMDWETSGSEHKLPSGKYSFEKKFKSGFKYDDKVECLDVLHETIMKVFETCERDGIKSVAIPAISAGIFGVPKQLCSDMYVKAIVDFDTMFSKGQYKYPTEVHFVDIDNEILKLVKESVQKWEKDPGSIDQRKTIPMYLKDNPMSAGRAWRRGRHRPPQQGSGQAGLSGGANFTGTRDMTVKIFKGDIDKITGMDVVVCGIGKDLEPKGFIADALKTKGGQAYKDSLGAAIKAKKKKFLKPDVGSVVKCKAGNLKVRNVFHVILEKLKDANHDELKHYKTCVVKVLEKSRKEGLKKIAMPMFATGLIQTNEEKLKKCCIAVLQAFDKFCDENAGKSLKITEIHLINNDETVRKALMGVFDTATKRYGHHAKRQNSYDGSGGNRSQRDQTHISETRKRDGSYENGARSMEDSTNRRYSKGKTYSSQDGNESRKTSIINREKDSENKPKRQFEKQPLPRKLAGPSVQSASTGGDNENTYDYVYTTTPKREEEHKPPKPTPEDQPPKKGNLLIFDD